MAATPSHSPSTPGPRLLALLDAARSARSAVVLPGAFNALCARSIAAAGFPGCYVSGAATSVCAGVPDIGLLPAEHFTRLIREIFTATGLPVLADADTGFGEAELVRKTVLDYTHAGAAALHLEDQQFPKRCGHLDGKALVAPDHMAEKVEWAARAAAPSGLLICARTDARGVEGLEAAVTRAALYTRAGAAMIFPEGLQSEAEFAAFADALARADRGGRPLPHLLANMTEFGKTPMIPAARFGQLGYTCVIYPVTLFRIAMGAVTRALATLRDSGSAEALLPQMQTRQELYALTGYTPGVPWELPAR